MKFLFKIIGIIGGAIALLKVAEVVIDFLYETYGKKYFTTIDD